MVCGNQTKSSRDDDDSSSREFEVGVQEAGYPNQYEHILVSAETADEAAAKAERRADFTDPMAYQAFDINEGVTHDV